MVKRECIAIAKRLGYIYDPRRQLTKSRIWFDGTEKSACLYIQAHNVRQSVKWMRFFQQRDEKVNDGSWCLEIGLCMIYHVDDLDKYITAFPKWFRKKEIEK